MALTKEKKSAFQNTKKQIRLLTKEIEQKAISKINKAVTCGALDENSDFLHTDNNLLARVLLEEVVGDYTINFQSYRKEADNLKLFL
jgi:hypothetical protein